MVSLGLFVALCGLSVSSADGWTESCLVRLLLLFGVVAVRCCSLVTEVCDCECCCCCSVLFVTLLLLVRFVIVNVQQRHDPRGAGHTPTGREGTTQKQSESRLNRGAERTPTKRHRLYAGSPSELRLRAASMKAPKRGWGGAVVVVILDIHVMYSIWAAKARQGLQLHETM